MRKLTLLNILAIAGLLLAGCAPVAYKPGAYYTGALSKTISHAQATTAMVYAKGAQPDSPVVKTIAVDLQTAQTQVVTVTGQLDTESKTVALDAAHLARAKHRIFVDDCIFAAPILLIGGFFLLKFLPLLAL